MPPLDYDECEQLERWHAWFRARLQGDSAAQRSLQRKYDEVKDDPSVTYEQACTALREEWADCLPEGDE